MYKKLLRQTKNETKRKRKETKGKKNKKGPLVKRFVCPTCNKGFAGKSTMNRHRLVHTGAKPFACPKCSRSYSLKHHLKEHLNTHLPEPLRPHPCPICPRRFADRRSLPKHLATHAAVSEDTSHGQNNNPQKIVIGKGSVPTPLFL